MPIKKQEQKQKTKKIKKPIAKKVVKKSRPKAGPPLAGIKKVKKAVKKPIKKPVKKAVKKQKIEKIEKEQKKRIDQIWATGKRKNAVATVRFFSKGQGEIVVNKRTVKEYFPVFELQQTVLAPLKLLKQEKNFRFYIKVKGGGIRGQAESIRLGIARALILFNPEWRKELKSAGFLRRDARKKERKKPGLKRARRAPQWAKR